MEEKEPKKNKKDIDKEQKLLKWQERLEEAKRNFKDTHIFDDREMLFRGTHDVEKNVNNKEAPKKKANNVVNIIYDLIESETDISVPSPSVRAKTEDFKEQAQILEDAIKNDILELPINKLTDRAERTTYVQGYSIIMVNWNPNFKHHLYRGEIELQEIHPKQLIPQPGKYEIQEMDYFFILQSVSRKYIKDRYGIELEDNEVEEYPEIGGIGDTCNKDDKVTLIIAWYKDKDNEISKFSWVNDVVIEDLPKYFYRRIDGEVQEFEELDEDIITNKVDESGMPIVIPAMSPVYDENGQVIIDELTGQPQLEPTKVPYFVPNRYPVIVRINVPYNFEFGGQSDVDLIRDQQDAIKKIISNIEEKIIRGGVIVKALDDHNFNLTNELYQVVRGDIRQLQALGIENLSADIQKEMQFAIYMYRAAQSTLGITDSFQGKQDNTATSGIAKQAQIQQAAGRLQSKVFNKHTAFKEMFETIFEFKLAFYDEVRPYLRKGMNNEDEYSEFNKYDFLVQDKAGEWYYYTDFLFSSDSGDGLPKDKVWLMEKVEAYYQIQAMDKVQFWTIMETLHFPNASEIKKAAQQEQEMQQQMLQQQAMQEAAMQEQAMQQQAMQQTPQEIPQEGEEEEEGQQQISQLSKEEIANIISDLDPEEQEQFFRLPHDQQLALIDQLIKEE